MSRQRQGGFLIGKIHSVGGRLFARMLREHQLDTNPAHGRVLYVLWQQGSMTINEIAKRVSLGKSTLTNTIDRLEAAGQVVRVRSPEDRRKILIELTPRNKALHKIYDEVSEKISRIFYAGLSREDVDRLERCLERILANLTAAELGNPEDGRE
jgi:MarR family transcriptional regulator, organic hydroperoxide resistance regulator